MKSTLSHALIIYFIGMFIVFSIKPKDFYQADGVTLKSWKQVDLNDVDSLYNIYVCAVVLALISIYLANEL